MAKPTDQPPPGIPAPLAPPDHMTWGKRDVWTLDEALHLLLDIDPGIDIAAFPDEARDRYTQWRALAERKAGDNRLAHFLIDERRGKLFLPWIIFEWAEKIGASVPSPLHDAVMEAHPSPFRTGVLLEERRRLREEIMQLKKDLEAKSEASQPPYLCRDHTHFSQDLALAVEAWTWLFSEGNYREGQAPKPQILARIKELPAGRALSGNARRYVTMVVNPHKGGGAPKTP